MFPAKLRAVLVTFLILIKLSTLRSVSLRGVRLHTVLALRKSFAPIISLLRSLEMFHAASQISSNLNLCTGIKRNNLILAQNKNLLIINDKVYVTKLRTRSLSARQNF